ncbi:MAG: hypothetical protein MR633_10345 [Faecalibacterium prausnitzii]|nr:hypothetical protein [Faecalibacterium prausnitzii]
MNDYNCRRLRSGNIIGNIIFIFAAQKSLRAFSELLFYKKGPQGKTGISDCKSDTPKHKGKDRQIAQGDYEQERAK